MREAWNNTFPKTEYTKRNSMNNKNNNNYHTKLYEKTTLNKKTIV